MRSKSNSNRALAKCRSATQSIFPRPVYLRLCAKKKTTKTIRQYGWVPRTLLNFIKIRPLRKRLWTMKVSKIPKWPPKWPMTGMRHAHISSLISGQNLGQIDASNHFPWASTIRRTHQKQLLCDSLRINTHLVKQFWGEFHTKWSYICSAY